MRNVFLAMLLLLLFQSVSLTVCFSWRVWVWVCLSVSSLVPFQFFFGSGEKIQLNAYLIVYFNVSHSMSAHCCLDKRTFHLLTLRLSFIRLRWLSLDILLHATAFQTQDVTAAALDASVAVPSNFIVSWCPIANSCLLIHIHFIALIYFCCSISVKPFVHLNSFHLFIYLLT